MSVFYITDHTALAIAGAVNLRLLGRESACLEIEGSIRGCYVGGCIEQGALGRIRGSLEGDIGGDRGGIIGCSLGVVSVASYPGG